MLVGATTLLVLAAFLVPLALLVRTVAADRAVNAATREAESVAPLIATVDRRTLRVTLRQLSGDDRTDFPLTVFLPSGTRIGAPAPESAAVRLARSGRSVTAEHGAGREILVAAQGGPGGTSVVRAYVSGDQLRDGVAQAWLVLGLLGLSLLALSLLVADRLARSLIGPIRGLALVAHQLAGGDLEARAVPAGPPEIREVAAGLNRLAGRISELLAGEREHVADLSHQLRTPMTALRLNVEGVSDPGDRGRLTDAVDGVERTVDRVIREARRPVREGVGASCDATGTVRARLEFWAPLAEEEGRVVESQVPDSPIPVRVTAEDLAMALDALLGNVFAHTPTGTPFAVRLAARPGGGAVLDVEDWGPGMADVTTSGEGTSDTGAAAHGSAVQGSTAQGSTGLGLDIVRRTAVASGGGIEIGRSAAGGALVRVELGPDRVPDR